MRRQPDVAEMDADVEGTGPRGILLFRLTAPLGKFCEECGTRLEDKRRNKCVECARKAKMPKMSREEAQAQANANAAGEFVAEGR